MASNDNSKTDINDLIVRINSYYDTICSPIKMMHNAVNSNVIKDIAFSSPYSIQMDTIFELKKDDIVSMFAGASDNDKKKLAEILRTQLKINGSTKYPIKLDYHQIVHVVNTVGKQKDLDGSCYSACFKVFAEKINQKQTKRRTLSTAIGYTSFVLGIAATTLTCVGYFLTTAPIWLAYVGLGIGGVFAIVTTVTRAINMINRTKNQNNIKIITNLMNQQQQACKNIKDQLNNFVKKGILSEYSSKQQTLVNNFSNPEENKNKDEQTAPLQSNNVTEVPQNNNLDNDDDNNIEDNNVDNIFEDKNEVNDNRNDFNNEINNENNEQERNDKDISEFNNNEANVNNGQKQDEQNNSRFSREEIERSRPDLMPIIDLEGKHMWDVSWARADKFFQDPVYANLREIGVMPVALWLATQEDKNKRNEMLEKICKVNDHRMNEINFPATMALVVNEFHKLIDRPIENQKVQDEIQRFLSDPNTINEETISEDMKQEFQKVRESFLARDNNINANVGNVFGNNFGINNNNLQLNNSIPRFEDISRDENSILQSNDRNSNFKDIRQEQINQLKNVRQFGNHPVNNYNSQLENGIPRFEEEDISRDENSILQSNDNDLNPKDIRQEQMNQFKNFRQTNDIQRINQNIFGANNMSNNASPMRLKPTEINTDFRQEHDNTNENKMASYKKPVPSKGGGFKSLAFVNSLLAGLEGAYGKNPGGVKLYNKKYKGINNGNGVSADVKQWLDLQRRNSKGTKMLSDN